MILTNDIWNRFGGMAVGVLFCITAGCVSSELTEAERTLEASAVVPEFPETFGPAERPAVEFDHGKHTAALEEEGCKTCHRKDDKGKQLSSFWDTAKATDRESLQNAYHDTCIGCHTERSEEKKKTGPLTCAECHAEKSEPVSLRTLVAFDYSLHQRHVTTMEKKCETCHHVYNKETQQLEYKKEAEDACRDCHGAVDDGKTLSLKNAVHRDCVGCHLDRKEKKLESGPIGCIGCHDADVVDGYEKLPEEAIERLKRKQPDQVWVISPDAKSKAVAFNHQAHEPAAMFCTSCHHKTPKPCKECHSLTGKEDGDFITMATAYHRPTSEHSCVGCHEKQTQTADCAGCHYALTKIPGERSCEVCHNGPVEINKDKDASAEAAGGGSDQEMLAALLAEKPELAPLPAISDKEFPEKVTIKVLADAYGPSEMPHSKIVAALDKKVRENKLAMRFHRQTETLCAGCHHHSPVGARPVPCRACHEAQADNQADKPGLRAAYHRQCMGCHQQMDLKKKTLGCTDCHEKATGEVSP